MTITLEPFGTAEVDIAPPDGPVVVGIPGAKGEDGDAGVADVTLSEDEGNVAELREDGLYVPESTGVPDGGTTGQVLTKTSNDDGDAAWEDPSGAVDSVNGETGVVVLDAADVGADPAGSAAQALSDAQDYADTGLSTKADLVAGTVPTAQLPAIAVTDYLGIAANEAAMLALIGQKGDWCTRSDTGAVWVITGTDPSILAGWTSLTYPASPVASVNGQTGVVVLGASDVGALGATASAGGDLAGNYPNPSIAARAVGWAKVAAIATTRILGRKTAGSGDVEELTGNDVRDMLPTFGASARGLVPAAGGTPDAAKFLNEAGVFAAPAGGGYATVKDEGTARTQRTVVDFRGAGVEALDDGAETEVHIEGPLNIPPVSSALWIPSSPYAPTAIAAGTLVYQKIVLPRGMTFNRYSAHVFVAAGSSSLRFGLYTDESGFPSTLVSGSEVSGVSATTTGIKFATLGAPIALSAGSYWVAVVAQGGAPTMTCWEPAVPAQFFASLGDGVITPSLTWHQTGVTGGLPASYDFSGTQQVYGHRVTLRRSA